METCLRRSPLPACGNSLLPCQLFPQLWVPAPLHTHTQSWNPQGWGSRGTSGSQLTQNEDGSTPTCQRSSSVPGTSSFLENLWGFLQDTSLPTRTEQGGWREKENVSFLPQGQLQITHLWFPETSSLSLLLRGGKKTKKSPQEVGGVKGSGDRRGKIFRSSLVLLYLTSTCPGCRFQPWYDLLPNLITCPRSQVPQHPGICPWSDSCLFTVSLSLWLRSPSARTIHLHGCPRTWSSTWQGAPHLFLD